MNMLDLIKSDLERKREEYEKDGGKLPWWKLLLTDGTSAGIIYRLMQASSRHRLIPLAYIFQYLNKILNQCIIGIHAEFSEGLVLLHPVGIVINSRVRGGQSILIEPGVVIGDEKGKSPVLSDNIFIGAGAKLIGSIQVGSNVRIGANAVVISSIEANTTVVGIPARPK